MCGMAKNLSSYLVNTKLINVSDIRAKILRGLSNVHLFVPSLQLHSPVRTGETVV
jgi:hypothetical protein